MHISALIFASLLSFGAHSTETVAPKVPPESPPEAVLPVEPPPPLTAKSRREASKYFGHIEYSHFDLIIPGKYGGAIGLIQNVNNTWELEYLRGSLSVPFLVKDLGSMSDERISLTRRSYFGSNSFNLYYGLTYFRFAIHLGDDLLNRVSGGTYPSIDLIELETLGVNLGIGNRWAIDKRVTFGIDWISWFQPLVTTKRESPYLDYATDPDDRDNVDTALRIISYFPRLSFLKLQLGVQF